MQREQTGLGIAGPVQQLRVRPEHHLPSTAPAAQTGHTPAWIDGGFAAANPYSLGETYQNYIDPALRDWKRSYYAENYERLASVKRAYDPQGFFRFAQAIV